MVRHVAREYHGVRPRLVRLVPDAIERCEIEHVPRSGGHDPVETARPHGVKQTVEVAKALRQRRTRESIGGRGARCIHHDRFSVAQPCICWIVELAIYCIPKQLTDMTQRASPQAPFHPAESCGARKKDDAPFRLRASLMKRFLAAASGRCRIPTVATAARVPIGGPPPKGTASMPKLYEALAEAFLAEGVDTQFVLMGDGNMHWSTAFAKLPGVHTVHVRHEHD